MNENEFNEIDLREILHLLRFRWWIIFLSFLICVLISGYISFYYLQPVYKAETSLFVGKEDNNIAGIDLTQLRMNNELVIDYREIIKSRLVSEEVMDELGLKMKLSSFQNNVEVTTIRDSRLFKISFMSTNPQQATDIANELARVLIEKAEEIIEIENVKVIDTAIIPENPIKPDKKLNLAIAGVLGIMLGAFIVFALEYLDHTIKNDKDVERYLGLEIIGEIPKFEGERRNVGNGKRKTKRRKH